MQFRKLLGHYFPYCQWCKFDGQCELKHCEFIGVEPGEGIDNSPYPGHENLAWHGSAFQGKSSRASCTGRISATDNLFYPLGCKCGTMISSLTLSSLFSQMCAKFVPNPKGRMREVIATAIIKTREEKSDQESDPSTKEYLTDEELIRLDELCPMNYDYQAEMTR